MKNLYSFIAASIFLVLACGSDDSDSKSSTEDAKPEWSKNLKQENGVWTLTYMPDESGVFIGQDSEWEICRGQAYQALIANPNITSLNIKIIDDCEDTKGNKSKFQSIIKCNGEDIRELRTYKTEQKFREFCDEWRFMQTQWYRCGWDGLQGIQHDENEIH